MTGELVKGNSGAPINFLSNKDIDDNLFLNNYMQFIPMYINSGNPSSDTLKSYEISIRQFLSWCQEYGYHPFAVHDFQMRIYIQYLYSKGYKKDSIALKLAGIRCLYSAACKIGLVEQNPCTDITVPSAAADEVIQYFSPEQIGEIAQVFLEDEDVFRKYRNTAILYLMGTEGLRNVEVHRMNQSDIDWDRGIIFIHGKGKDRNIFPNEETLKYLDLYLQTLTDKEIKKDGVQTPLFVSDSHKNLWGRMSRNGLRFVMNKALELSGYKKKGFSCHIFRHSVGTNLYQATRDLRLVQETLGHSDPKVTTRYAHLMERMSKRQTSLIVPKLPTEQKKGE